MLKVIGLLTGLLFINHVQAEDISGAFGMQFGATVETETLKQAGTDRPYGLEYAFIPANPYNDLSDYSVFVTPQSQRVYQIQATATFTSMKGCRRVLEDIEQVLEKKYHKTSDKLPKDFGASPKISFAQASRRIEGVCTGFLFNKKLTLVYTDTIIRDQAAKENQALQDATDTSTAGASAKQQDTSGL